jgi:hypothetical protein
MPILYFGNKISDTKMEVITKHYMPDMLTNEEKVGGILVDEELPKPEPQDGKRPVLYINPQTKEQWYEFVDVVGGNTHLTTEQRIAQLEKEKSNLQQAIDDLTLQLGDALLGGAI